jgi:hypothetical protein
MRDKIVSVVTWVLAVIVLAILALLMYGVIFPTRLQYWVGTAGYVAPNGTMVSAPKTLWDLVELLIIPAVLSIGALLFNRAERQAERRRIEENERLTREISAERNQESIVQTYIDRMSDLMIDKGLSASEKGSPVRAVARTQTRTVLYRLTGGRKGLVVRFLREAGLIESDDTIVNLAGTDLRKSKLNMTNLGACNLSRANLMNVELERATLHGTLLIRANLTKANLREADLRHARLSRANLSGADLSCCNLSNSDLIKAVFCNANVSRAIFDGAKLNGANFSKANLCGARFDKTEVSGARFQGALFDSDTRWPDGFQVGNSGARSRE